MVFFSLCCVTASIFESQCLCLPICSLALRCGAHMCPDLCVIKETIVICVISLGSQAVSNNSVSPPVTIVSFRGFAAVTFASVASCAGMLPATLITRPSPQCCPSPASSRMSLLRFAVSRHQSLNRNVCACLTFLSHSGAVHTCVHICVS